MKAQIKILTLLSFISFLSAGCDKVVEDSITPPDLKEVFNGYVQKGPYIIGSSVTINQLDAQLNQTGNVFFTQIIDNSGNFEERKITFTSSFIELKADGYYFNEVKGENSTGQLTLYGLADITDINSVNVNILTHLERQRIIYLVKNEGLSFSKAKKQAMGEVLNLFKFALPENSSTESLNITGDALLLAVSAIVQGNLSTGDMSELLASISADIRTDGILNNPALGSQLINNAVSLDLEQIKSNMENKYRGLGIEVNINSSELYNYVRQFIDNSGFKQTSFITYPETGLYGLNILHEGFVEAEATGFGRFNYSVKAVLPAGKSSLKVVLKTKNFRTGGNGNIYPLDWGGWTSGTDDNWLMSRYDAKTYSNTLTVIESGKPADVEVIFLDDCIVEYYENGAIIPTKVKEIKVIKNEN